MKKTGPKTASVYNHKVEPIATWSRDVVILGVILGVSAFGLAGSLLFTAAPGSVCATAEGGSFLSYYSSIYPSHYRPYNRSLPLSCVFLDRFFVSRTTVRPNVPLRYV